MQSLNDNKVIKYDTKHMQINVLRFPKLSDKVLYNCMM